MVSCIMPIKRPHLVGRAIRSYQAQHYADRELVIYEAKGFGGAAFNEGCARAKGDIICLFCDDDWSRPERISFQVEALKNHQVVTFTNILYWDGEQAYEGDFPTGSAGYSLCFRKSWWEKHKFLEDCKIRLLLGFRRPSVSGESPQPCAWR